MTKPTKPKGWVGHHDADYWYKHSSSGMRAICTTCGHMSIARPVDDRYRHVPTCPRIAGPRKEWEAWVSNNGEVKVQRHSVEKVMGHESREEALRALDASLRLQLETIDAHRATVARLLKEGA
jgi:hypothetical protein